ncbi:MAG: hypothetical protein L0387_17985 [Acidobacteria bacterium]|nr:hypothetical protein [Acidobacteriota bacterium]MCI0719296.1 hypothetical protein [Acidobacteriota bacterium]
MRIFHYRIRIVRRHVYYWLLILGTTLAITAGCGSGPNWTQVKGGWDIKNGDLKLTAASEEWSLAIYENPPHDLAIETELTWQPCGIGSSRPDIRLQGPKNFGLCARSQMPFQAKNGKQKEISRTIVFYQILETVAQARFGRYG